MDRPTTSTNPLFIEQDEDPNNYVTKNHLFSAQTALHQGNEALSECLDLLTTDLRQSDQCTGAYFDNKLDTQKDESNAGMDKIRALLVNLSSTSSSYSRWSHTS